jgi:hypothetical protein
MKVLIDSDAFCKLACCGLLERAIRVLGAEPSDARRLPALQHMLQRGKLAWSLGHERAEVALAAALTIDVVPEAEASRLQQILDAGAEIDSGEAQLLAIAAANTETLLVTGDKRALRELSRIPLLAAALTGRIVTLEAVLIALCDSEGEASVRGSVASIHDLDGTIKACFSSSDSGAGLQNYQSHFVHEVPAGLLWSPG